MSCDTSSSTARGKAGSGDSWKPQASSMQEPTGDLVSNKLENEDQYLRLSFDAPWHVIMLTHKHVHTRMNTHKIVKKKKNHIFLRI